MKLLPLVIVCLAALPLGGCLGAPRPTATLSPPEHAGASLRVPTTLASGTGAGGASTLILGVQ